MTRTELVELEWAVWRLERRLRAADRQVTDRKGAQVSARGEGAEASSKSSRSTAGGVPANPASEAATWLADGADGRSKARGDP